MQAIELVKLNVETLKRLSKNGVKTSDCKYIGMYNEYKVLVDKGHKKEYARAVLSERYKISKSTVYRVLSRLESQVKI